MTAKHGFGTLQELKVILHLLTGHAFIYHDQFSNNTVHDSILSVTNGITPTRTEVSALPLRLYSPLLGVIPKEKRKRGM